MIRRSALSLILLAATAACSTSPPRSSQETGSSPIAVTVLTTRGCAQTDEAIEQVSSVAASLAIPIRLERILVETPADAARLHLLGSPTFLVDGRDIDPAVRDRTDFGFSWRTYGTSAVPPEELVARALREAAVSTGTTIIIEARGFGWGAVPGLGWGSTLAPVLARLGGIAGVRDARVDWTGRYFLLRHDVAIRSDAVVAAAGEVLGPTTKRLAPIDEQQQIATFKEGAPWLRAGETARLSKHEAETLARRYATTAARSIGLEEERVAKVVELAQEELVTLFKRFETSGLPSRDQMQEEWTRLIDRVTERSHTFLTDAEAARLGAALEECCARSMLRRW